MISPYTLVRAMDAIAEALELTIPSYRGNVRYRRWRGEQMIETVPLPMRERGFQLRLGSSVTPRTMSTRNVMWMRSELQVVIGYNLTEPRNLDWDGMGIHQLPQLDEFDVTRALTLGGPLRNVPDTKTLVLKSADPVSTTSRTYRFDFEWAERRKG